MAYPPGDQLGEEENNGDQGHEIDSRGPRSAVNEVCGDACVTMDRLEQT